MLVIKYQKTGSAKYIPHVDMLRQVARILRRAKISVAYSQGFNPHELIFFAPPTPLGMTSTAEYCTIFTDEPKETFKDKFNRFAMSGIICVDVAEVAANPNLAGKAVAARYEFDCDDCAFAAIENAFSAESFFITFLQKGEEVTKEVRPLMLACGKKDGKPYVMLAHGNTNLRADKFLGHFGIPLIDIVKTEVIIEKDGQRVSADEYFD